MPRTMNIGTNTTPIVAEPRAQVPVADITAEEQTLLDKAARHRRTASRRRLIDRIIIIALILGIWEGVVAVGWIQPFFVSRPSLVMVDLWHLISTGYVFRHLAVTTYEALLGLLLG